MERWGEPGKVCGEKFRLKNMETSVFDYRQFLGGSTVVKVGAKRSKGQKDQPIATFSLEFLWGLSTSPGVIGGAPT